MKKVIVAAFIGLTAVVGISAQSPAPAPKPAPKATPATVVPVAAHTTAAAPVTNVLNADSEKELFTRYCVGCHNEKAKNAGVDSSRKLTIDSIDFKDVRKHAEKLELIVRKMRAGMMPPVNVRRPEPVVYKQMISWLENELDR